MRRAVTLDAAGTLLTPAEPVGRTYASIAAAHGIPADPAALDAAFRRAFASARPLAFPDATPATRPARERAWWAAVVRAAFGPLGDHPALPACFAALFAHYARAGAWRVYPEVPDALRRLRERGFRLAVVSNFDGRLPPLLRDLGIAPLVDVVVHSSAAGAAKPDPAIFRMALDALGVPAAAAAHVGDDPVADVAGARAAGLGAVLVDRHGRHTDVAGVPRVPDLAAAAARLGDNDV